jgi:hypothetical protein
MNSTDSAAKLALEDGTVFAGRGFGHAPPLHKNRLND